MVGLSLRNSALAFSATLALAGPAFAHAHLKSAVPPENGRVSTSPSELDLHFTEGLNLRFTGVSVKGPHNAKVTTGKAKLKSGDDQTLTVPVTKTLEPGKYTVSWHALSKDGHKTKGSYGFAVTSK